MNSQIIDKKTIGLTPNGETIMDYLMSSELFKDKMDAAKLAMSVAINADAQLTPVEKASTIWNIGSFDSDNQMRQLIPILYPDCETPYRAIESLIESGLRILQSQMKSGNLDIPALLKSQASQH